MWQNGKIAKIHTYIGTYIWQHVEQEAATVRYRVCDCECDTMNHLHKRKNKESSLVHIPLSPHYRSNQKQMCVCLVLGNFPFSDLIYSLFFCFFLSFLNLLARQPGSLHTPPPTTSGSPFSIFVSCSLSCVCMYVCKIGSWSVSFFSSCCCGETKSLSAHTPTYTRATVTIGGILRQFCIM